MTKILRNHIIHEFAGICYENLDLYHERHDKRSRWVLRVRLVQPQMVGLVSFVLCTFHEM